MALVKKCEFRSMDNDDDCGGGNGVDGSAQDENKHVHERYRAREIARKKKPSHFKL